MTVQITPATVLRRMVEIYSPTGAEDELADYVVRVARHLGLAAHRDDAGNAVAVAGDAGPTVMMLGHLDTVPGRLPVCERDGVLYGRGAVDAKGALAAMLWAAAGSARAGTHRVAVVGAVGEEGDSPGARHLLTGPRPDAVIVGEPSGYDTVVVGYKGILRLRLDVTRPPVHSSRPDAKAVEVAADFWQDARAWLVARHPTGSAFHRAIPTLVALHGDARRATLRLSCRTPPGFDVEAALGWLHERAGGDRLTVVERMPAVRSSRADPVASALAGAIRDRVRPPATKLKLGTCDMNVVAPAWSVPIAAYGPGDARLDHTEEERIDLAEFTASIGVLADAAGRIARAVARDRADGPW
ncbi:M20/M25/M40 family metallo-hydrolase [Plantactinospora sp. B6F1]|uniref:M20/M25/M40 family metallo-hydrolase n=1 Tax=Plantactinospora sp. B6F1 TaxID=3158971 RepID=UPI0032D94868